MAESPTAAAIKARHPKRLREQREGGKVGNARLRLHLPIWLDVT